MSHEYRQKHVDIAVESILRLIRGSPAEERVSEKRRHLKRTQHISRRAQRNRAWQLKKRDKENKRTKHEGAIVGEEKLKGPCRSVRRGCHQYFSAEKSDPCRTLAGPGPGRCAGGVLPLSLDHKVPLGTDGDNWTYGERANRLTISSPRVGNNHCCPFMDDDVPPAARKGPRRLPASVGRPNRDDGAGRALQPPVSRRQWAPGGEP